MSQQRRKIDPPILHHFNQPPHSFFAAWAKRRYDSIVGEAVLKGRLLGKLTAERSLEIHTTAEIKGSFKTTCLIIPPGHRFRWPEAINLVEADIGGELVAHLQVERTIVLRSTARLFGDVKAGSLVVEEGAVFVGAAKVGP